MTLNFNADPYYDDFDEKKNYHRILFKPGYAVQARELTQSQTIQQNQITNFADAIFSQNTPISGGKVTTNSNCYYIKLVRVDVLGSSTVASRFMNSDGSGKIIQNVSGTVVAQVIQVAEGTTTSTGSAADYPTLVINYLSGSQFSAGDTIKTIDGTNITSTVLTPAVGDTATGYSSVASVSKGVFYVNGFFVACNPQTVILSKYSNTPSARVGLVITESIVDTSIDSTLLDPAISSTNYQAPGADRYKLDLVLSSLPLTIGNDSNFIELLRLVNGQVTKQVDSTVYSVIDDYFAKRTYDTNGDFTVKDFNVTASANTVDSSSFDLRISKGIAYVKGYRLESQSDTLITVSRARTTTNITNAGVLADYGSYFFVNTVKGTFDTTAANTVDFHSVSNTNIVSTNTTTYNSTLVATGYMRGLDFDHYGTSSNTSSYVYRAYVTDIQAKVLTANVSSAANTSTITFYDTTGKFSSTANAYYNVIITIDSGTSAGDTRTIVNYNGTTKTAVVNPPFSVQPDTTSNFSLRFKVDDIEEIVNTNSGYSLTAYANIDASSKDTGYASGNTIIQAPGNVELIYPVGYSYVANTANTTYETTKLFKGLTVSSNSFTLSFDSGDSNLYTFVGNAGTTLTSDVIRSKYTVVAASTTGAVTSGNIIDFSTSPATVAVASDQQTVTFTYTGASGIPAGLVVNVYAKVNVTASGGNNSSKVLKIKNLYAGNTTAVLANSTLGTAVTGATSVKFANTAGQAAQVYIPYSVMYSALSTGQSLSLYFPDVKQVTKIIDTGASGTDANTTLLLASSYDVTNNFSFDNGQRDNFYDFGSIKLKPNAPVPKGNLLVVFDYYAQSGGDGYFSTQSYTTLPDPRYSEKYSNIPAYTARDGINYSLGDCLDFRPCRVAGTTTFVFRFANSASTNKGILIPSNLRQITTSYNYYLGRKDKLVLTKDKSFVLVKGSPSAYPIFPPQPDGSLLLANLTLDPYTAFVPGEASFKNIPNLSMERVQHKRFSMQDIADLQTRINNIEYYSALNVLEQQASSLQVPDVNGLNRFKNGILVDDFSSFSVADTYNIDFNSSINKRTRQLTAAQKVSNFPLQSQALVNSLGSLASPPSSYKIHTVNKSTNIFTLPYTTANVINQNYASNTISVNPFATPIFQGSMDLNPPMDNWVDTTKAPDIVITNPGLQVFQQSNTVNLLSQGDWKVVPGTTSTSVSALTSSFNVLNHGRFNGPFGTNIGYTQTTATSTTTTFGTLAQNNILGAYSQIGNTYSLNNGYITDISIQPYIRSQQLLFKAKGLKVNAPLSAWFDGVNVDRYITSPDIVELTGVTGTFYENDVIGYSQGGTFYPVATIVSVYAYPGTTNVRLYITGNFHSSYAYDVSFSTISNATFDGSKYNAGSASGTLTASKIVNVHKSGYIGAVGGTFTDVLGGTSLKAYRVSVNHGAFADKYGIWSTPTATGTSFGVGTFYFTVPTAGTYYMRINTDDAKSGYIAIDGTSIWTTAGTSGVNYDYPVTLSAGQHTLTFNITSSQDDGDAYIAFALSGSSWQTDTVTAGPIYIASDSLHSPTTPLNGGTQIEMPGGGLYYVGATQLSLNGIANTTNGFYTGSSITFKSVYITTDVYGNPTITPSTSTATVTNYIASNTTVFLDTPVNLSVGGNAYLGGDDTTSSYTINGTQSSYKFALSNGGLSKLSTDESGNFTAIFNIPGGTFRTGDRVFRVDNRTVPTAPNSATTYAQATFTASGLAVKSQALDFGPSIAGAKNTFTNTNYLSNQTIGVDVTTITSYSPWDPLAQTFIVSKDNYPNGLFLSSVKFFFQDKPQSTNDPITLSIVNTLNGYPNGDTLDYSIVTLTADKVNVSSAPHYLDQTTATTFTFDAPIYIQPNVLYAFLLKSPSMEYVVYLAEQNGTALPSTSRALPTDAISSTGIVKLGSNPYVGSVFESQNGITWTADQTKSLMFVADRCVFNTSATPNIPFVIPKQLPYRKLVGSDFRYYLNPQNSGASLQAMCAGVNVASDAYNITTTQYVPTGTSVSYTYNATYASNSNKTGEIYVDPGKFGSPSYNDIYLNDGQGERVLDANSNSSFTLTTYPLSTSDKVSPVISDDGLTLYNIQWNINNLGLSNSVVAIANSGSGYYASNTTVTITAASNDSGSGATAVANVTSTGTIDRIYITAAGSNYAQTPTITISGAGTGAAANLIGETSVSGGNALARYVTKKVVLTPGLDSGDLRVYYTAYRPVGTNIYVYYKILNSADTQTFDSGYWQLMTTVGLNSTVYSTSRDNLIEFQAAPGINNIANNYVSYTSTNGQTYTNFIQFAIKVVLATNDNTNVPFLTDIRTLALPSGSGL